MLGKFQKSELRIEVKTTQEAIGNCLLDINQLKQWFFPLKFDHNSSEKLSVNDSFSFYLGVIEIKNKVDLINSNGIRIILSGGIDGYQEWTWGDGWIQSRLEGVSILPLNLAQTLNLLRLKSLATKESI